MVESSEISWVLVAVLELIANDADGLVVPSLGEVEREDWVSDVSPPPSSPSSWLLVLLSQPILFMVVHNIRICSWNVNHVKNQCFVVVSVQLSAPLHPHSFKER